MEENRKSQPQLTGLFIGHCKFGRHLTVLEVEINNKAIVYEETAGESFKTAFNEL